MVTGFFEACLGIKTDYSPNEQLSAAWKIYHTELQVKCQSGNTKSVQR